MDRDIETQANPKHKITTAENNNMDKGMGFQLTDIRQTDRLGDDRILYQQRKHWSSVKITM
jgi:hypothetical protein